ncbi:MAG: hypothetical protein U9N53_15095 [Bacteroidota bacterium]|nr:hypothetical protein [Bacteroidota bacterium]
MGTIGIMANKTMILYDFEMRTPQERTNIIRKLFGFTDKSNRGSYTYKRKGLLSDTFHEQGHKRTLIIKAEDEEKVIKILKRFNINAIRVRLENKDEEESI